MDYTIRTFVDRLRTNMYLRFPYESDMTNYLKHVLGNKNPKPKHIRDVAFMDNPIEYIGDDMLVFEIGNEFAEREYPYYHILEDAPVIRKKGQATEKTKGSQDKITNLSARDYGIITFNGKTFSKEYSRNVRGKRASVIQNSTRYINGKKVNRGANSYQNVHYHYIENMLLAINPILADEFGMKYARVGSADLQTDYILGETDISLYDSDYLDMAFDLGNI